VGPDRPLVTVVTPSYNYGRFIGRCLDSVRRQTYPAIEHIVLDALSSDDTHEVLRTYEDTYRLTVVREKDRGQANALNKGFGRASGGVLCWLNADDFWLHDEVVAEAMAHLNPDVDLVTGGGRCVDEEERVLQEVPGNYGFPLDELCRIDTLLQPATFWRRSVHRALREDVHYAFDWRLFLDMRASGARFLVLSDPRWAAYRWHAVNKTSQDPACRKGEIAEILREQCGLLSPEHLWTRAVQAGYVASETLRLPKLKTAVKLANDRVRRLTKGRVYSP
jgi:glycosyltransferase involved in cell wall biosynthesis